MRVLFVTSELAPLAKTGGLGDVAAALPAALRAAGVDARVILPGYPAALAGAGHFAPAVPGIALPGGHHGTIRLGTGPAEVPLYLLDAPSLFDRHGGLYGPPGGGDWPDNHVRFAALGFAAAAIGRDGAAGWRPDVVHCHDWQAGLAPAYLELAGRGRTATVMTIHNLAYQGQFSPHLFGALGLPEAMYSIDGVEYYGGIGFLKAGLYYADRLTTVSPTYAEEIQTAEQGMGLDGLLRTRAGVLTGIINGIDTAIWDPAQDPFLPAPYGPANLRGKSFDKAELRSELGLAPIPGAPLFGIVSRLTWQKGVDLVCGAFPALERAGAQLVVLGSGDGDLEASLADAAAQRPGRVAVRIGFDEGLAHRIQAGADVVLVPSRWEPCGLTQLSALRYGALPLVRRAGGLADTVTDLADRGGTGFLFDHAFVADLDIAIRRAASHYPRRAAWRAAQRRAMARDVSWAEPARRYAALYRDAIAARAA